MRLANKVALVTGGGTGIGKAIAVFFAAEGAKVAVSGRTADTLNEVVEEIRAKGGEAIAITGDVGRHADAAKMVQTTVDTFGRIDVLVNNAGHEFVANVVDTPEEEWDRVLDTNLKSIYLLSREAIPHMRKQGGGNIINVASQLGTVGVRLLAAYSASKGGAINLSRSMALDHAEDNIRVNALCPGAVESVLFRRQWVTGDGPQGTWDELIRKHPVGRIGQPEEIAWAAVFMASDEASFMTGATVILDGGYTAM